MKFTGKYSDAKLFWKFYYFDNFLLGVESIRMNETLHVTLNANGEIRNFLFRMRSSAERKHKKKTHQYIIDMKLSKGS